MTVLKFAPTPVQRRRRMHRPTNRVLSTPRVNIIESDDSFLIQLAVPGVAKDQVKVDVKEDQLIIDLAKEESTDEGTTKYLRKEYDYSTFKKVFNLSDDINQGAIEAALENGVLSITLEKKEEAKAIPPKSITIK